jgi:hypothetical protein
MAGFAGLYTESPSLAQADFGPRGRPIRLLLTAWVGPNAIPVPLPQHSTGVTETEKHFLCEA